MREVDSGKQSEIIKAVAEITPFSKRSEIDIKSSRMTEIPLAQIAMGVGAVASLSDAFRIVTTTVDASVLGAGGPGIYKLSFPNGVTGALAQFRDGSGFLGSIMDRGVVGQARLNPIDNLPMTTTVPIDPMMIAVAIAVASIDKKLDKIIELQDKIIDFLERDKKAELEASLHALNDIRYSYQHNWNDESFTRASLVRIMDEKKCAKRNVVFYSGRVKDRAAKKDLIHFDFSTDSKLKEMQDDFDQYRLALYLYSYASFLEVILLRQFSEGYISSVTTDIEEHVLQYRLVYTDCYNLLEAYSKRSVETFAKGAAGFALKGLGNAVKRIPVIEKGSVDEALLSAGEAVSSAKESHAEKALGLFVENKNCGAQPFVDTVKTIGRLCNDPIEFLIDGDEMYLLEETNG
ncbi:hypothetical protein [Adlercreutzia sp. ZJ141]|uniref:hypothetical protein n=1 Tax=Adlercreutzia sp. ZJ141 TaxID=2709406 RepID=UPI0013EC3889|nr:hypothetical protein [Adlercreutzia sp. ZJ141]